MKSQETLSQALVDSPSALVQSRARVPQYKLYPHSTVQQKESLEINTEGKPVALQSLLALKDPRWL